MRRRKLPKTARRPQRLRKLRVLAPFLGLCVALAALYQIVDFSAAWGAVRKADLRWISVAVGLVLLATELASLKLWFLLRAVGQPRRLGRCWSAVMGSLTLNAFLPAKGGDLFKAELLRDAPEQIHPLLGVVLCERAFDVLVLGLISLLGSLFTSRTREMFLAGSVSIFALVGLFLLGSSHRFAPLGKWTDTIGQAARHLWRRPLFLAPFMSLTLIAWTNNAFIMICLLRATGADRVPLADALAAAPLAILSGMLPVSVSGMGTRDGALVMLLARYGQASAVLGAGFLYTALAYWLLAGLGFLVLAKKGLGSVVRGARSKT